MTEVVSLIRKRDLSFRVFKYSFLTELFVWQNKNAVLFNKEDNFPLRKLKLAAILFFSSPGEVPEMVYYHFINSLGASVVPSLKPYPSLGQMRNGVFKIKCFGKKMRKCFTSVPHFPRQIVRDVPLPPAKLCHTRRGSIRSTQVLSFNAVLTSSIGKLSFAWFYLVDYN